MEKNDVFDELPETLPIKTIVETLQKLHDDGCDEPLPCKHYRAIGEVMQRAYGGDASG